MASGLVYCPGSIDIQEQTELKANNYKEGMLFKERK
jgi:hypothetical protein